MYSSIIPSYDSKEKKDGSNNEIINADNNKELANKILLED